MNADAAETEPLLAAIAAGDAGAFAQWMALAEPPLRGSLRAFAALADTEAVLQETLLRVWQVAPRVVRDGRAQPLLRLAHTIARNLALSEARRLRAAGTEPEALERLAQEHGDPRAPSPPDPLLRASVARCREALPEKPAQALRARLEAAGGEDDHRLAAALGMKLNTFLQNFSRARKLLHECLARAGIDVAQELR